MQTVIELRERSVKEAQAARDIQDKADADGRGLTTEEESDFNKHLDAADALERQADRQERLEEKERKQREPKEKQARNEIKETKLLHHTRIEHVPYRGSSLRAYKGANADANAYRDGKWLAAALLGHAESRQYCNDHNIEIRRERANQTEERVQTESVNTAGGYIVPDTMERSIIDLREEYGDARRNCRVVPMTSDHTYIPRRSGGLTSYFIGETTSITESDKTWDNVELTAKKLACLTRMSSELSEDSIINVADDLAAEMGYAFALKEDQCWMDGSGAATYGGMIGMRVRMINGAHAGSYYTPTACDNWIEVTVPDLVGMAELVPEYVKEPKWYCSRRAKVGVFDRLANALGGNTNITIAAGALPSFMGMPIIECAAMPVTDAAAALNNTIMLFCGDFKRSTTLGDRRGITVKVSQDRYLEYDQIAVQATERFCIVNHDIAGAAGTYGPVVGLIGVT